jgi:serine protease Do
MQSCQDGEIFSAPGDASQHGYRLGNTRAHVHHPNTNKNPSRANLSPSWPSVAAIAGVTVLAGPGVFLQQLGSTPMFTAAHAAETTGPAGFADVVQKVKPAVISVRVKLKSKSPSVNSNENSGNDKNQLPFPKGSPFERFFRDFGLPNLPNGRQFTLAQGSGFFISPDGYAVTSDHVVDKAQSVEITTDEGKTYTAKVVGEDSKTDVALIKVDAAISSP